MAWATAARARAGGLGGAGEVEEVGALGVVELERSGQRFEHALGGAAHVAVFQARVVLVAHAGQDRDLLAAQSGDATGAVVGHPACSGVIRARREVRNSRNSCLVSTKASLDPAPRAWESLRVALSRGTTTFPESVVH